MPSYWINADSGDNANTGAENDPWETVAYAISQAVSGDTIIVQTTIATYTIVSQTFTKNLTIQGDTSNVKNHLLSSEGSSIQWKLDSSVTVTIKSLDFSNTNYSNRNGLFTFNGAVSNSTWYAENCEFHDIISTVTDFNGYGGIFGSGFPNPSLATISLISCAFYNNQRSLAANRMHIVSGRESPTDVTIILRDCTIFNNVETTVRPTAIFSFKTTSSSFTMTDCIIRDSSGTDWSFDDYNFSLFNSITANNNILNNISSVDPTVSAGAGTSTDNPLFVDEDNADFNLRQESSFFDAGS